MRWQGGRRSVNVKDMRGSTKAAAGGGGLLLLAGLVVWLLGGDPSALLMEGASRTVSGVTQSQSQSPIPKAEQDELVEFVTVVLGETEHTWTRIFKQNGSRYIEPKLVVFNDAVQSGCGRGQRAMGPFYCPADSTVYLDLAFFHDLRQRHKAPGDFAQAYVIAHEVGHHVENLLGVLDHSHKLQQRASKTQANQVQVKVELMADCLAGVWAHDTQQKGMLERGDTQEALKAASQIGDDTLQRQAQGRVVPDSFTHGSSAQRVQWFNRGLKRGDLNSCNTFS